MNKPSWLVIAFSCAEQSALLRDTSRLLLRSTAITY